jgi:hypothetical protein
MVHFQASAIISKKIGSVKLIPEYSVTTCILCIYLYSSREKLSNLSQITSKIHTVAMFLTVDLETIFNTKFVCMYMIYLHTKFHVSNSNGSSGTAIKLEAKYRFHAATTLLSYSAHTHECVRSHTHKTLHLSKIYHTKFQDHIHVLCGFSVVPTS